MQFIKKEILKRTKILPTILLFSLIIFILSGCKKDPETVTPTTLTDLEHINLPAVMMTLSAMSYVADSQPAFKIKDTISLLLRIDSLATAGMWKIVWGPAVSGQRSNMAFVVKAVTSEFPVYAIVIRGTNTHSHQDILQDVRVLSLRQFHYGEPDDMVSKGAMEGFDSLLKTPDNETGQ